MNDNNNELRSLLFFKLAQKITWSIFRLKYISLAMKCLSSRDAHVLLPQFKICCPASCKLSRQIAFGEIKLNIKNLNLPQDLSVYTLQFITSNDNMKQFINHTYNLKIKGLDFYWNIRINDFVPFHFLLALSCRQKICINQDMAGYI